MGKSALHDAVLKVTVEEEFRHLIERSKNRPEILILTVGKKKIAET
jgi:hypothetical protein